MYIYGAGKLGKKCYEDAKQAGYECKGFIVTDKQNNPDTIFGLPVIVPNELKADDECIVAVKDEYKGDVINNLRKLNRKEILLYTSAGGV